MVSPSLWIWELKDLRRDQASPGGQLAGASAKSTPTCVPGKYLLKCNDIMNTPPKEDGEGDPVSGDTVTSAADISASISFGDDEDMAAWANVSAAVTEAVLGTAANNAEGTAAAASGLVGKEKGAEDEPRAASRGIVTDEDPMMPGPEESMDGQSAPPLSATNKTSVIQERNEAIHNCTIAYYGVNSSM